MADQIKKNLQTNLSSSDTSTGDLISSLGITPSGRTAKVTGMPEWALTVMTEKEYRIS